LWRDHIGISLEPQRLALVRMARGLRPRVTAKHCVAVQLQTGENPWRAALASLVQILDEPEWGNADATVVLSNHFVRYACIPWHEKVSAEDEQLALARHCFTKIYGDAAQQGWELRLSAAQDAAPRLASAVEGGMLEAVHQACTRNNLQLCSIQPFLMAGFNHCAEKIGKNSVWVAVMENGILCLALIKDGQWRRIRMHRDTGMKNFKVWLDRENLAADLGEPCREVLLFAPEAVREPVSLAPYQVQRFDLAAYHGFSPHDDAQYAMAMSGVR